MWGVITKFFVKTDKPPDQDNNFINNMDTQETRQAKQKASVKWILSKAFNNRVPDNLKDPFYRDHEGQEHLKPQIVVGLGNATLYCQTLSNLYSDPNYQSLNHWSILQTLTRKGVPVSESPDMPLTETVLIQTNPLRINAHMSVIEALMILYAKEVSAGDRISAAIGRISGGSLPASAQHHEAALLCWISHVCAALKRRINQEIETGAVDENGTRLQSPDIPPLREYRDLCDGVCLAFLISYYCPKVVPWTSVRVNYLPAVEDSIHNVLLVSNFSQKHLPYSVFHMTPEDITYMRGSMKQNLVVLLGDLFNLFELHPAKCVCYPGMDQQQTAVMRSPSASTMRKHTPPRDNYDYGNTHDEGFVVHKSKGVPTLSSMQEPLVPARLRQAKEKSNTDTKADERGDTMAAGRPSNWEEQRRPSYAGRRSRRNSFTDDSQLTIENFGGSQDQLNMIGRTMEQREQREPRERKISNTQLINAVEQASVVRSTLADARGSIRLGYDTDSGSEKQDRETEKTNLRRQTSMDNVSLRNVIQHSKEKDIIDGDATNMLLMTATTVASQYTRIQNSPPINYDDNDFIKSNLNIKVNPTTTTFASSTLPKQTTWQQQSANLQQNDNNEFLNDETRPAIDASKLSTVRMKLEEKRRHIEQEKRKIEVALSRQQQKVGKAAFLQAINKDITSDVVTLESKWDGQQMDTKRTPDLDHMDLETYQQSIAMMNTSLHDIQADIQRLAQQQNQIQAQHIQAQQLLQAQQYANIMQQQYGSQHNIQQTGYRPIQQNFGSSPHLSSSQTTFTSPNSFNMRPQSRDSAQQQQPIQFINDQGQYVQQTTNQLYQNNQFTREQSPSQYSQDNGHYGNVNQPYTNQYIESSPSQYGSNQFINRDYSSQEQQFNNKEQFSRENSTTTSSANKFYLHDSPTPPLRRTWAQSAQTATQQIPLDITAWSQNQPKIDSRTWKSPSQSVGSSGSGSGGGGGFVLHQNGGDYDNQEQSYQNLFSVQSSPQHTRVHKQISQIINNSSPAGDTKSHIDYRDNRMPRSPPIDEMAPQSISFIGDEDSVDPLESDATNDPLMLHQLHHNRNNNELDMNLAKLNISSGSRTYRIPSPTRPTLNPKSFQDPQDDVNEKGFYISFDDQPKRPKPPLRTKKSPKKERSVDSEKREQISQLEKELDKERLMQDEKHNRANINENYSNYNNNITNNNNNINNTIDEPLINKRNLVDSQQTNDWRHQLDNQQQQTTTPQTINNRRQQMDNAIQPIDRRHLEDVTNYPQNVNNSSHNNETKSRESKALVIGAELSNLDPTSVDEMERKKEKIMLLSLQRRQQQEEVKARKEIDAMQRRDKDREKEDERARKREEQAARRQAILEAHKLKKTIEEAEREGKTIDKADLMMMKQYSTTNAGTAKLRPQKIQRPRPKTIHVETGSVDLSEASSLASRGKKGSSSNLTGMGSLSSNSMRRDYYRGSQDSLAIRESPDEYPSTSSTPLGRRGSYKTAREPTIERGRTLSRITLTKGSSGANFRGRKSNSLMNLCDTDSGLGRATPPRRAPSPGMGPSSRHLPSPSGPGSLPPGLMTKRRMFDDGSSDISSTASSMMEYTGPKLYKQPATKSNRGIILNAVEYCVFPGVVNKEAKQKVLEKIARSEAKHFLVLFRDAGCQFRALYSYWPENETILKLYGTGPSQVDDVMFDKFFKYNSGGKCFAQVHTKHLTVTIDAFTIHNSLWQGKKVHLPSKKDMALVI